MLGIMNAWLQNSAVMGLVGVIIGSVVSFAGIIYSERVKLKTLEEELQYKEKEKRNLAYKDCIEKGGSVICKRKEPRETVASCATKKDIL